MGPAPRRIKQKEGIQGVGDIAGRWFGSSHLSRWSERGSSSGATHITSGEGTWSVA